MKNLILILLPIFIACDPFVYPEDNCAVVGNCRFSDLATLEFNGESLQADGKSKRKVTITFNGDADSKKAIANCDISNGTILESMSQRITVNGKKLMSKDSQLIFAEFNIQSSTVPQDIELSIEVQNHVADFTLPVSISEVRKVELSADKFSVANNYQDELIITGELFNADNNKVSSGHVVKIIDSVDGVRNIGNYRNDSLSTDGSSKVSVVYSPGKVEAGKEIIFEITEVIDPEGNIVPVLSNVLSIYIREI